LVIAEAAVQRGELGVRRHDVHLVTGEPACGDERIVGTYLHGPVLPRNPALADHLLTWVTGGLPPLPSDLEARLHDTRVHAGMARGIRRWWRDRMLARG